jgi:hypothetical protein
MSPTPHLGVIHDEIELGTVLFPHGSDDLFGPGFSRGLEWVTDEQPTNSTRPATEGSFYGIVDQASAVGCEFGRNRLIVHGAFCPRLVKRLCKIKADRMTLTPSI